MSPKFSQNGFIALVSTLIISAVLLSLMFTTSTASFYARFDALASEYKRTALGLAESCANAGLLKIAQNYDYSTTTDQNYVPGKGVRVDVGEQSCYIQNIIYSDVGVATKTATILTSAQFPSVSGAWSNSKVKATVQNPTAAIVIIPPTCNSFTISPTGQISSGSQVTLAWDVTNAERIVVNRITSTSTTLIASTTSPIGSVVDTPVESATYVGIASGSAGIQTMCTPASIAVKPTVGECADTVVMFDRSGSLFNNPDDPYKEGVAIKSLISFYDQLSTSLIGIGSFGGIESATSVASVPTTTPNGWPGWLSTSHGVATSSGAVGAFFAGQNSATSSVNQWSGSVNGLTDNGVFATDSVNGHLQAYLQFGLNVPTNATINGVEVTLNAKTSLVSTSTGLKQPTQNGNPNEWGNPSNAFVSDNFYASTNDDDDDEGYRNFNFNIPAGATISGIEVKLEARQEGTSCQLQSRLSWDDGDNFVTRLSATPASSDTTLTYGSPTSTWGRTWSSNDFSNSNFALEVRYNRAGGGCGSNDDIFLDQARVNVYYTQPSTITATLSSNNGISWTGSSIVSGNLPGVLTPFTLGGPTNTWGIPWTSANIGNLAVRLQNNIAALGTTSLDSITARVYYTSTSTYLYNVVDQGLRVQSSNSVGSQIDVGIQKANAELNSIRHVSNPLTGKYPKKVLILISDGDANTPSGNPQTKTIAAARVATTSTSNVDSATTTIFTISYGAPNSTAQQLMTTVASKPEYAFTAPSTAAMIGIFDTIGNAVCPAASAPSAPLPVPNAPPAPPLPTNLTIGSWDEIINITAP